MKLSVIIPALNEAENIETVVEQANQLRPHEVIVVDGGSEDCTVERAARCDCHVVQTGRGRAQQQNAGARAASGDVLLFLHADCRLVPEAASQIERAMRSSRIPGGAFRHRIDARGLMYRVIEAGDSLRVCCSRIAYGDQGIFLRREVFDGIGGFPEVKLMEDVQLTRLLRGHGRLVLLPGPLWTSARRWQNQGVLRQTLRNCALRAGENLGVHPDRLARYYSNHVGSYPDQPTSG